MKSIGFFIQQLISGRRARHLTIVLCLFSSAAQSSDAIRHAVKLRVERKQEVEIDADIELKKGEESSPISPQELDGLEGRITEPFAPDPQEKKEILARKRAKERKAKTAKIKKKAITRYKAVLAGKNKKRRVKKGRRFVGKTRGKAKRRPASIRNGGKKIKKKFRSAKGRKSLSRKK